MAERRRAGAARGTEGRVISAGGGVSRSRGFELPLVRVVVECAPGLEHERGRAVRSSHDAARVLAGFVENAPATRRLAIALLDARQRLLAVALLDGGTWSACCLRPSEVYEPALLAGATSLYLAHRHPSKTLWAVRSDCQSMATLWHMSANVGLHLHDHLIFDAHGRYASLRASVDAWSSARFANGTSRLRLPAYPPGTNDRNRGPRVGVRVHERAGGALVARMAATAHKPATSVEGENQRASARLPAVHPHGFELCGLRVRLVYDAPGIILDHRPTVHSHADVAPLLARFVTHRRPGLVAGLVNRDNRLFAVARIDDGHGRDGATPATIYRAVIACGARAVYLAQRHSTDAPEPSSADLESTGRTYALGFALGLELRDSLIFGGDGRYVSLRERGEGAEDWRHARDQNSPDFPCRRMRLHQAGGNRRPERPGSMRSAAVRAAVWRCAVCQHRQTYKHTCRYCGTPRP